MLHLVPFYHVLFLKDFHCKYFLFFVLFYQQDLPVASLSDNFYNREVVDGKFAVSYAVDIFININLV